LLTTEAMNERRDDDDDDDDNNGVPCASNRSE
jgi:hypothetical protein